MHEIFTGSLPMHVDVICVLMNIALVLGIAALVKYLIKGKCGCCNCGCSCCKGKKEVCGTEK